MNHCHLSRLVQKQAEILGQRVALRFRDYEVGQWRGYTWQKFAQRVDAVSRALIVLGVGEQENVALFSQNKPEYLFVEFGSFGVRAVTVPFYATCSAAQVQYMLNDAEVRVLFVGEQQQYDVAMEVVSLCKKLEKIIIFDPQVQRKQGDSLSMSFADFLNLGKNATPADEPKWNVVVMRHKPRTEPIFCTLRARQGNPRGYKYCIRNTMPLSWPTKRC